MIGSFCVTYYLISNHFSVEMVGHYCPWGSAIANNWTWMICHRAPDGI